MTRNVFTTPELKQGYNVFQFMWGARSVAVGGSNTILDATKNGMNGMTGVGVISIGTDVSGMNQAWDGMGGSETEDKP